ncbi:hypothetical protein [Bradyrhizobium japonicum]|uniref:hypothetical protein n=1 Tax=Bradyrhizobium japonicum TaxID=375 RepID=UPI0012BD0A2D|nr:hypothetical protein [Bradyrhizobium japonicum]WLB87704.1 hypothetical protein QIH91_34075 [Bradyrhizobium japonicum USDA 135]
MLLSRAKRLLVLVGSWDFYEFQLTDVTSELHPRWHWKNAMAQLKDDFKLKRAVMVAARYPADDSDAAVAAN